MVNFQRRGMDGRCFLVCSKVTGNLGRSPEGPSAGCRRIISIIITRGEVITTLAMLCIHNSSHSTPTSFFGFQVDEFG